MRTLKLLTVPLLSLLLAACQRQQTAENRQDSAAQAEQRAQQAEQTAKEARDLANRAQQQANEAEQRALETRQRAAQQQASRAQQKAEDAGQKLAQRRQSQQDGHAAAQDGAAQRPERAQRASEQVTVPAGVAFNVRLDEPLDTSKNKEGDTFTATLDQPVTVNDRVAIPAGTRFTGSVVTSEESGRLSGEGVLTVTLSSFELNGRTHRVATSEITKKTGGHAKRNTAIIGGGSGAGAAIGGITGGKKGAAIGAGAGAAAGTAGAAITGKLNVRLPAETELNFTLESPLQLG